LRADEELNIVYGITFRWIHTTILPFFRTTA
jgi:hypothetical protein